MQKQLLQCQLLEVPLMPDMEREPQRYLMPKSHLIQAFQCQDEHPILSKNDNPTVPDRFYEEAIGQQIASPSVLKDEKVQPQKTIIPNVNDVKWQRQDAEDENLQQQISREKEFKQDYQNVYKPQVIQQLLAFKEENQFRQIQQIQPKLKQEINKQPQKTDCFQSTQNKQVYYAQQSYIIQISLYYLQKPILTPRDHFQLNKRKDAPPFNSTIPTNLYQGQYIPPIHQMRDKSAWVKNQVETTQKI